MLFDSISTRKAHQAHLRAMMRTGKLDQDYIAALASYHPKCVNACFFRMSSNSNGLEAV